MSGTILGSFSLYSTSIARPLITWEVKSQNIANNTSEVEIKLFFRKSNSSYYFFNASFAHTLNIDGNSTNHTDAFNLPSGQTGDWLIRTRTRTVTHNSNGTKSIWIGGNGDTGGSVLGTYNFGSTVTLPTIPREAEITNSVSFTVGNNIPLTISNPGNFWVQAQLYVGATLIKTQNLGQVTSSTLTLASGDNDAIYALMPNSTSSSMYVRCRTFDSSGYSTQIGSNKDRTGTVSINQSINRPTFTDWALTSVDKAIEVRDKYNNLLTTSNTNTLTGSTNALIKGYNTARGTVSVANKAVALNSATMVKYRMQSILQSIEASFSDVADVVMNLQNVTTGDLSVTAIDSRTLSTLVDKSIGTFIDYNPVAFAQVQVKRDNNVDSETKLIVSGAFFDDTFGSVANTITAHYRYKESTEAWGAQTWNALTFSTSSGEFTFDNYIQGDLGASGFEADKSYNVEVRVYDKLSASIFEIDLSRGIPTLHFTQEGVAVQGQYDDVAGGVLQVNGDINAMGNRLMELDTPILGTDATNKNYVDVLHSIVNDGWIEFGAAVTRVSNWNISVVGDFVGMFRKGTRLKFTQSGTKYNIVRGVSFSGGITTINLALTIDTEITANPTAMWYSYQAKPKDFPDWFQWAPSFSASGSMTVSALNLQERRFQVIGDVLFLYMRATFTTGGTASDRVFISNLPVPPQVGGQHAAGYVFAAGSADRIGFLDINATTQISCYRGDFSNWTLATNRTIGFSLTIRI
jgi:hypothetical protein